MIEISSDIQIKSTIKPGSVYYFVEDSIKSGEPHYFIVINNNPKTEKIIILVCSSSRIDTVKYRRKHIPKTLVDIAKTEYKDFSKNSIVDCNEIFEKTIDQIVQKLKSGELKTKSDMDSSIVEEIRQAVINSPIVDQEIIDQLIG